MNRLVHHFVCQLHVNELPLCRLLENLDGEAFGPYGPIDKIINQSNDKKIIYSVQHNDSIICMCRETLLFCRNDFYTKKDHRFLTRFSKDWSCS